jgi:riboflavin biosynthesis pyrimidine reductase
MGAMLPSVRQLHPVVLDDIDPYELYAAGRRPAHDDGRPWLMVNMVTTLDGATTVGGVSGPLGGEADKAVFRAIRSLPDVILVAAGTVNAEGYGPPRLGLGAKPAPRLAVVTASLSIEPTARLFAEADPDNRPFVVTATGADPERLAALAAVSAEVIVAGDGRVDVRRALHELGARGAAVVLCEGGPSLNGQLIADDLVDELCLTVAPVLASGDSPRIAHGPERNPPQPLPLATILEQDGVLCLRYVRAD